MTTTVNHACNKNIALSYVVPVHNAKSTIVKCVESCINPPEVPCEILLVENGSTDSSPDVCRRLSQKHPTVSFVSLDTADVCKARNWGIEHSRGKYIAFVDADDWVDPSFAKTVVSAANDTGADIVRCGYNRVLSPRAILRDKRNAYPVRRIEMPSSQGLYETLGRFFNPTLHGFTPSGMCGGIFLRELLTELPLEVRESGLRRQEDMLVCSHAFVHARKILFIPDHLYMYRYGGVTSTSYRVINDLKRFLSLMEQTHNLKHEKDYPLLEQEFSQYVIETVHDAYFALSAEGDQGIRKFYEEAVEDAFVLRSANITASTGGKLAQTACAILTRDVDALISLLKRGLRLRRMRSNMIRLAARSGLV